MGTDIHSVGQVFVDGHWSTVLQDVGGDARSYATFALLADVRNGFGFAGVKTGEPIVPIAPRRGPPEDFVFCGGDYVDYHPIAINTRSGDTLEWMDSSSREKRLMEKMADTKVWMGDHSHSWLSLHEIQEYAQAEIKSLRGACGLVTEIVYKKCREGRPRQWCGGASGHHIVVMDRADYDRSRSAGDLPGPPKQIYVRIEWQEPVVTEALDDIIKDLKRIGAEHGVDAKHVRMVFGFDS